MILLLPVQTVPPLEIRREIAVGEHLLLLSPQGSYETVVANDGRIRLATGERVVAVRRTIGELRDALPTLRDLRRVVSPNSGFPILPNRTILSVADGTPLIDALRGLPSLDGVTIIDAQDRATPVESKAFSSRQLLPGDALILGRERTTPRASIIGGVARPGVYEIVDETTLGALVAKAGNLTPRAQAARVTIERDRKPLGPFAMPGDAATPVRAGDVVRVPVGPAVAYVSVVGAVKRPGLIEVAPDMTVVQAIEAAGGLTLPRESLLVALRSVTDAKRKAVKGRATDLSKFPVLKGGDILEVAPPPPRPQ